MRLYRNFGGTFGDATECMPQLTGGVVAAVADLDGDGDEDVYLGSQTGDRLVKNLANPGSWLQVRLQGGGEGGTSPRDPSWARLTLGGAPATTRVVGEGGASGQSSRVVTIPWREGLDHVTVEWPSGTIQRATIQGPGLLSLVEGRPSVDLALRALVTPLPVTNGEATVAVTVEACDNGLQPLPSGWIVLTVRDESGGLLHEDSLAVGAPIGPVSFEAVPAPPEGIAYSYHVRGVAPDDVASWNDEASQLVVGGPPSQGFEGPPVYWTLSECWRWARSNALHPAASGEGFLLLSPLQEGHGAQSPPYRVEAGTVVGVRFMCAYSLPSDSVVVSVLQDDSPLATTILTGESPFYVPQVLSLTIQSSGQIVTRFSLAHAGGPDPSGFFRLDEFEVEVVASGESAPFPTWVSVAGPWPNPSKGLLSWRLTLPSAGTVRVEAFDLAGRRVAAHSLGQLPSGTHTVETSALGLAPGVYVARFSLGPSSCSRPFVRVR